MVDTHAHLSVCEPDDAELVAAARDAGVRRILTVGMEEDSNAAAIAAAEAHDEVLACVGRHPNSAAGFDDDAAERIAQLADHPRVAAIGETGLDYYRDRAPRDDQRRAFEAQIETARRAKRPVVIHMRESVDDTFEVLRAAADGVTVILHCFSAPAERVDEAAERGWYCSFAGNLTYPKAEGLREAARLVPDELLLVETDSPFLAPQPYRGKPNQPANVVATAEGLAELRGLDYAELEELVERNAARAFGW
ncbi:MAG TPA: TatD family hydrolase [Solirubrobacterales bacterium]|nr:TatD family hydrolase [Solirubrobacterales bacterium]